VLDVFFADMSSDPVYGGGPAAPGGPRELPAWATYPEGLRRVETLPVFTEALLARGFAEAEVAAIMGGNALRVLRRVLPG
jgi:microsomal dipeptidase-like Zn-dependent dipeptidase